MLSGSSPDDHFSETDQPLEDALYDLPLDNGVPLPSEVGVKPEDLEDQGPPEKKILEEILERVRRIEEQLENGGSQAPSRERRSLEDMFSELIDVVRRMERSSDEISDLRKRVSRIEGKFDSSSVPRGIHGQGPVEHAKSPTDSKRIGPGVPEPELLKPPAPSEGQT
jgi:hypothetical protein